MTLTTQVKHTLKKTFHKIGLDVHQITSNPSLRLSKALKHFEINTVFDIGANKGQFASEISSFGYDGKIVCFEPLSEAYEILCKNAAQEANWHVHQRCAIGDFDGEIEINIAGNSASSSVLPMLERHTTAEEKSAYIGSEKVPIAKLDSFASDYFSPNSQLFIKIDTQGFEWQVLDGAQETLNKTKGLLCELSFVPLYDGQHLWLDMLHRLEKEGFTLWAIQPGFVDPHNGQTLQADAVFFRIE